MQVLCPKCNADLLDPQGGGVLTKCRRCGYDGDMGMKMSYLKNEYEIENNKDKPILKLDKDNETSTDR